MQIKPSIIRIILTALAVFGLSACQNLQQNKVSVKYYNISGNSTAALDRQIKLKGPKVNGGRHAVAVAKIKMMPNIIFTANSKGCRVTRAKVAVSAQVTLPKWTGHSSANKDLIKAWESIDRYTRLHESVHVAIAFRFAKQLETTLAKLHTSQNCDGLKIQANTLVENFLDEHDKVQKKFDADEQARFAKLAKKSAKKSG